MKILYSINAEGMGHTTRSKAVIDFLIKEGHEVKIIAGERSTEYLKKHYQNIHTVEGVHLWYHNNAVRRTYTVLQNILFGLKNPLIPKRVYDITKAYNPDLIISDYTIPLPLIARLLKIPCITLDNNRLQTVAPTAVPYTLTTSLLTYKAICPLFGMIASAHIIPSFVKLPVHPQKKATLVTPPLREELIKHKPTKGKHLLVYQTDEPSEQLITELQKVDHPIILYGKTKGKDQNITYKQFAEEEFFKDLAACKAVIMNGSFSLLVEALHLEKAILSIPIIHQFEQEVNAQLLNNFSLGMQATHVTHTVLLDFLNTIPQYEKNIKKHKLHLPSWKTELKNMIKQLVP